jgi:hypothetical protein
MSGGDRLVLIGVARDELEAGIWRDILARDGIAAFIKTVDPLAPFGVAPVPGSLEVFVRAEDERRARWLLGDTATSSQAAE